ncbi:MAG: VWA domain-containing protein [Ruminococcus flavefaciens]|nr:VWA domain-containing protein [Ruminococcus flavefaciens]MCM1061342.1 VWA domain-containing protein [Eubacterium sp.]
MKKNFTELVFILDKSGSMSGLESDTIGGFNSMLQKQKGVDGECRITTVLFDNNYTLLHDRIDIRAVSPMTDKEYFVGGSTALLDAIGTTINKLVSVQRNTSEDYRAEKVMFVIITDGDENSSREYSADKVRGMIEHEKEMYGWEFIFLLLLEFFCVIPYLSCHFFFYIIPRLNLFCLIYYRRSKFRLHG